MDAPRSMHRQVLGARQSAYYLLLRCSVQTFPCFSVEASNIEQNTSDQAKRTRLIIAQSLEKSKREIQDARMGSAPIDHLSLYSGLIKNTPAALLLRGARG